jgi:arylsulfatase A-like enzyme
VIPTVHELGIQKPMKMRTICYFPHTFWRPHFHSYAIKDQSSTRKNESLPEDFSEAIERERERYFGCSDQNT